MRHGFAVSRIRVIYNSLLKRGHMGIKVRLIEELRVPFKQFAYSAIFARHIESTKRYARLAKGNVRNFQE